MLRLAAAPLAIGLALAAFACGEKEEDPTLPPRQFEPATPQGFFGVNGQGLRPLAEDGELELLDDNLGQIAAGGLEFVRANTDWPRLEPEPPQAGKHSYEFAGLDTWVAALAGHGLTWAPAVMGVPTPEWAVDRNAAKVCGLRAFPARNGDFAALSAALATRYGRNGTFWRANPDLPQRPVTHYELWNEPNLGSFWCPVPDPAAYAALADAAADAIRAVDPGARLVMGGLASFHTTGVTGPGDARYASSAFLRQMLAARPELRRKLDVIGVHAYGPDTDSTLQSLARQRAAVDAAGLGAKPLAYSEVGWYTSGVGATPAVDEDARAAYLAEVTAAAAESNCGIESFAPHTWITLEEDPLNIEDWYGIADPGTGEPYASGQAYLDQALLFEGRGSESPPAETVPVCRGTASGG
jgi:hypothetical protein